jgi:ATP-dependent Clp protease ATP-binding subunit ClpX
MADQPDPQKIEKEFLDSIRRMMSQINMRPQPQEESATKDEEEKPQKDAKSKVQFNLKPKEVKKYLDRYVIKQEDAKRVLATAICDHYNHISQCEGAGKCKDYAKQNVLMLGPTGVGKTYLVKSISELVGVPFTKGDATKFSETGYVGGDVEDLVRDLVHRAQGDITLAECGIIYLDEIDKIASASNLQTRDVSGVGVQRGLLKIMEDTEVALRNPQDMQSQMQAIMEFQQKGKVTKPMINTRHILFIVSGAFDKLPPIIERRWRASNIGFTPHFVPHLPSENLLREARTEDFMEFGFEPEFIGRLPVRVICQYLSAEDLYAILTTSEGSILRQYRAAFKAYGIDIRFEDDALWEIAKGAAKEGTGARGLITVCEKVLRDLKYELPSSKLKEFVVTRDMVLAPEKALRALLSEERKERSHDIEKEIQMYAESFFQKNGIRIEFTKEAAENLLSKIIEESQETRPFLEKHLSSYAYGLGLIQKKKAREKFILDEEVIKNPNAILEQWIKEAYER